MASEHVYSQTCTAEPLRSCASLAAIKLDAIAKKLSATPSQVALAWTLKRSPVMLPIPGTSRVDHLEENVAAASLALSDEDFSELDRQAKALR
ncbi:MAG TPA: aldo/keto reductase [Candidatus Acidoferrum sp.]|nr:aldo/keto reductase [Candidatus Acidoferrum sp.]